MRLRAGRRKAASRGWGPQDAGPTWDLTEVASWAAQGLTGTWLASKLQTVPRGHFTPVHCALHLPQGHTVLCHLFLSQHRPNGHEFEQTPGDSEALGSLACCSLWGRKESDTT